MDARTGVRHARRNVKKLISDLKKVQLIPLAFAWASVLSLCPYSMLLDTLKRPYHKEDKHL